MSDEDDEKLGKELRSLARLLLEQLEQRPWMTLGELIESLSTEHEPTGTP